MTSVKENKHPFILSEKHIQSLSNTALTSKSQVLLKFKERLENVEVEFDNAKEELKTQRDKIDKLKDSLKEKDNECKTLETKIEELNGKFLINIMKKITKMKWKKSLILMS